MPDLEVRVATADDVAAAGALTAEAYHSDGLIDDGDEYLEELLDAARRADEATLLVALVPAGPGSASTVLVGTVTLAPAGSSYAEIAEPGEVEVRMLAVAPEARRRGVAEALTRAVMLHAVTLGARRVVLSTLEAMTVAQRLYRRLGFVAEPGRDWHHEGVALRVYAWDVPVGPGIRVETVVWHPREVRDVAGWRVGLSGGFTRRANSVVALSEPDDVVAGIDEVERIYAEAGQPPIFRVCAQSRPEDLDDLLRARGYRDVAHTLVMVRGSLEDWVVADADADARTAASSWAGAEAFSARGAGVDANVTSGRPAPDPAPVDPLVRILGDRPDEEWLSVWLADRAARPVDRPLAESVVTGARAVFLSALAGGTTVGVIRAAFAQDWVGLSCLTVAASARGRGIGRALTRDALRIAVDGGARRAFLQVEESNEAAIALYETLGFAPAERYHYRQR